MPKFAIVEFVDEKTVEFIPCSWLCADNKSAHWPGFVSRIKVAKAIQSEILPDDGWKVFSVRIMAFAGKGSVHITFEILQKLSYCRLCSS